MKFWDYVILSVAFAGAICPAHCSAGDLLTVMAVGDIIMGTTYPSEVLPPKDGLEIFDPVKQVIRQGNIAFGNLEGPLIDGGTPSKCGKNRTAGQHCYEFRMPGRYGRHLRDAGFNVLSIANNHAADFGLEGLESTISILASGGIQAAGGSRTASFRVRGKRIAVAGFSYLQGFPYSYSILDTDRARTIVSRLKSLNDVVIVSFHGGAEGREALDALDVHEVYRGERRGNPVKFSRAVIDSGADLVLGHGPHVPRALELYKGKLIAYSLGNFVAYGVMNTRGPSGLGHILKAKLDMEKGDFVEGNIISVDLTNKGLPSADPENKAFALIKRLTEKNPKEQQAAFGENGEIRLQEKN
jgi:poly-gamma-glutamate capsule biosynthesis protein CapA/YwtB (metallophosphatase superfamily)